MILRIVTAALLLMIPPALAQVLINIDAATNDSSLPVIVPVAPGTYQAKLVPGYPGALYSAWSNDSNEAGTWGTHHCIRRTSDGRLFFGGRAAAADSPGQALSRTPNRAVLVNVPTPQNLEFYVSESTLANNLGGVSVLLEPVATQPGRIGADPAGVLRGSKVPMPDDLRLEWGPSCSSSATDYAVYEGTLGSWGSHVPNRCTTAGATSTVITPMPGDSYFLIVPQSATEEGSYGTDSSGVPRGQSMTPCRTTSVLAECPVRTETIFIGTGDVDTTPDYNGILRITESPPANSGNCFSPRPLDASLAMNTWGDLTDGDPGPTTMPPSALGIFPHGIFYSRKTDELFIAALYTTDQPSLLPATPCGPGSCPPSPGSTCSCAAGQIGSLGVLENARSLGVTSPLSPNWYEYDRHVYHHGWDPSPDLPELDQPHSVWYDHAHGEIYIANSEAGVSVFGHLADGNVAPRRAFTHAELSLPVSVAYDVTTDVLFVGTLDVGMPPQGQVAIFKRASTRTSGMLSVPPDLIVYDPAWQHFIHNVWYDPVADAIWVGNHSETVYRNALRGLLSANEFSDYPMPACSVATGIWTCDLSGALELALDVQPGWIPAGVGFVTGGIWFDVEWGRLYATVGESSGGPVPGPPIGTGTHVIMVYNDARSVFTPATPPPSRTVCWENVGTYYGPQPISASVEY